MITFIESLSEDQKELLWVHIDALIKKAYDDGVLAGLYKARNTIDEHFGL